MYKAPAPLAPPKTSSSPEAVKHPVGTGGATARRGMPADVASGRWALPPETAKNTNHEPSPSRPQEKEERPPSPWQLLEPRQDRSNIGWPSSWPHIGPT